MEAPAEGQPDSLNLSDPVKSIIPSTVTSPKKPIQLGVVQNLTGTRSPSSNLIKKSRWDQAPGSGGSEEESKEGKIELYHEEETNVQNLIQKFEDIAGSSKLENDNTKESSQYKPGRVKLIRTNFMKPDKPVAILESDKVDSQHIQNVAKPLEITVKDVPEREETEVKSVSCSKALQIISSNYDSPTDESSQEADFTSNAVKNKKTSDSAYASLEKLSEDNVIEEKQTIEDRFKASLSITNETSQKSEFDQIENKQSDGVIVSEITKELNEQNFPEKGNSDLEINLPTLESKVSPDSLVKSKRNESIGEIEEATGIDATDKIICEENVNKDCGLKDDKKFEIPANSTDQLTEPHNTFKETENKEELGDPFGDNCTVMKINNVNVDVNKELSDTELSDTEINAVQTQIKAIELEGDNDLENKSETKSSDSQLEPPTENDEAVGKVIGDKDYQTDSYSLSEVSINEAEVKDCKKSSNIVSPSERNNLTEDTFEDFVFITPSDLEGYEEEIASTSKCISFKNESSENVVDNGHTQMIDTGNSNNSTGESCELPANNVVSNLKNNENIEIVHESENNRISGNKEIQTNIQEQEEETKIDVESHEDLSVCGMLCKTKENKENNCEVQTACDKIIGNEGTSEMYNDGDQNKENNSEVQPPCNKMIGNEGTSGMYNDGEENKENYSEVQPACDKVIGNEGMSEMDNDGEENKESNSKEQPACDKMIGNEGTSEMYNDGEENEEKNSEVQPACNKMIGNEGTSGMYNDGEENKENNSEVQPACDKVIGNEGTSEMNNDDEGNKGSSSEVQPACNKIIGNEGTSVMYNDGEENKENNTEVQPACDKVIGNEGTSEMNNDDEGNKGSSSEVQPACNEMIGNEGTSGMYNDGEENKENNTEIQPACNKVIGNKGMSEMNNDGEENKGSSSEVQPACNKMIGNEGTSGMYNDGEENKENKTEIQPACNKVIGNEGMSEMNNDGEENKESNSVVQPASDKMIGNECTSEMYNYGEENKKNNTEIEPACDKMILNEGTSETYNDGVDATMEQIFSENLECESDGSCSVKQDLVEDSLQCKDVIEENVVMEETACGDSSSKQGESATILETNDSLLKMLESGGSPEAGMKHVDTNHSDMKTEVESGNVKVGHGEEDNLAHETNFIPSVQMNTEIHKTESCSLLEVNQSSEEVKNLISSDGDDSSRELSFDSKNKYCKENIQVESVNITELVPGDECVQQAAALKLELTKEESVQSYKEIQEKDLDKLVDSDAKYRIESQNDNSVGTALQPVENLVECVAEESENNSEFEEVKTVNEKLQSSEEIESKTNENNDTSNNENMAYKIESSKIVSESVDTTLLCSKSITENDIKFGDDTTLTHPGNDNKNNVAFEDEDIISLKKQSGPFKATVKSEIETEEVEDIKSVDDITEARPVVSEPELTEDQTAMDVDCEKDIDVTDFSEEVVTKDIENIASIADSKTSHTLGGTDAEDPELQLPKDEKDINLSLEIYDIHESEVITMPSEVSKNLVSAQSDKENVSAEHSKNTDSLEVKENEAECDANIGDLQSKDLQDKIEDELLLSECEDSVDIEILTDKVEENSNSNTNLLASQRVYSETDNTTLCTKSEVILEVDSKNVTDLCRNSEQKSILDKNKILPKLEADSENVTDLCNNSEQKRTLDKTEILPKLEADSKNITDSQKDSEQRSMRDKTEILPKLEADSKNITDLCNDSEQRSALDRTATLPKLEANSENITDSCNDSEQRSTLDETETLMIEEKPTKSDYSINLDITKNTSVNQESSIEVSQQQTIERSIDMLFEVPCSEQPIKLNVESCTSSKKENILEVSSETKKLFSEEIHKEMLKIAPDSETNSELDNRDSLSPKIFTLPIAESSTKILNTSYLPESSTANEENPNKLSLEFQTGKEISDVDSDIATIQAIDSFLEGDNVQRTETLSESIQESSSALEISGQGDEQISIQCSDLGNTTNANAMKHGMTSIERTETLHDSINEINSTMEISDQSDELISVHCPELGHTTNADAVKEKMTTDNSLLTDNTDYDNTLTDTTDKKSTLDHLPVLQDTSELPDKGFDDNQAEQRQQISQCSDLSGSVKEDVNTIELQKEVSNKNENQDELMSSSENIEYVQNIKEQATTIAKHVSSVSEPWQNKDNLETKGDSTLTNVNKELSDILQNKLSSEIKLESDRMEENLCVRKDKESEESHLLHDSNLQSIISSTEKEKDSLKTVTNICIEKEEAHEISLIENNLKPSGSELCKSVTEQNLIAASEKEGGIQIKSEEVNVEGTLTDIDYKKETNISHVSVDICSKKLDTPQDKITVSQESKVLKMEPLQEYKEKLASDSSVENMLYKGDTSLNNPIPEALKSKDVDFENLIPSSKLLPEEKDQHISTLTETESNKTKERSGQLSQLTESKERNDNKDTNRAVKPKEIEEEEELNVSEKSKKDISSEKCKSVSESTSVGESSQINIKNEKTLPPSDSQEISESTNKRIKLSSSEEKDDNVCGIQDQNIASLNTKQHHIKQLPKKSKANLPRHKALPESSTGIANTDTNSRKQEESKLPTESENKVCIAASPSKLPCKESSTSKTHESGEHKTSSSPDSLNQTSKAEIAVLESEQPKEITTTQTSCVKRKSNCSPDSSNQSSLDPTSAGPNQSVKTSKPSAVKEVPAPVRVSARQKQRQAAAAAALAAKEKAEAAKSPGQCVMKKGVVQEKAGEKRSKKSLSPTKELHVKTSGKLVESGKQSPLASQKSPKIIESKVNLQMSPRKMAKEVSQDKLEPITLKLSKEENPVIVRSSSLSPKKTISPHSPQGKTLGYTLKIGKDSTTIIPKDSTPSPTRRDSSPGCSSAKADLSGKVGYLIKDTGLTITPVAPAETQEQKLNKITLKLSKAGGHPEIKQEKSETWKAIRKLGEIDIVPVEGKVSADIKRKEKSDEGSPEKKIKLTDITVEPSTSSGVSKLQGLLTQAPLNQSDSSDDAKFIGFGSPTETVSPPQQSSYDIGMISHDDSPQPPRRRGRPRKISSPSEMVHSVTHSLPPGLTAKDILAASLQHQTLQHLQQSFQPAQIIPPEEHDGSQPMFPVPLFDLSEDTFMDPTPPTIFPDQVQPSSDIIMRSARGRPIGRSRRPRGSSLLRAHERGGPRGRPRGSRGIKRILEEMEAMSYPDPDQPITLDNIDAEMGPRFPEHAASEKTMALLRKSIEGKKEILEKKARRSDGSEEGNSDIDAKVREMKEKIEAAYQAELKSPGKEAKKRSPEKCEMRELTKKSPPDLIPLNVKSDESIRRKSADGKETVKRKLSEDNSEESSHQASKRKSTEDMPEVLKYVDISVEESTKEATPMEVDQTAVAGVSEEPIKQEEDKTEPEPPPKPVKPRPKSKAEIKRIKREKDRLRREAKKLAALEALKAPPPNPCEDDTRMSASDPNGEGVDDGSGIKKNRMEVGDPEGKEFTVEQIAEYQWPLQGGELYMIQEQISTWLGVKSFQRKYPDLKRRRVEMEERTYLCDSGLVSESMCDLGLTAVSSSEVLDIMFQDFPDQYEELRKHMREKQARELINKQKEKKKFEQTLSKSDLKEHAIQSLVSWNTTLNRNRNETRKCHLDLQTWTIQYPRSKAAKMTRPMPKLGGYPVALIPGQYSDYYKRYTPQEMRYFPVNTVLYGPLQPNERHSTGGSDGSQSDSEDSSSSDGSSESSSEGEGEGTEEEDRERECKTCGSKRTNEAMLQCSQCSHNSTTATVWA